MNNILTIIKKELKRFFGDKRMLMSLILPGLLIFVLYSIMGSFVGDAFTAKEDYVYNVYIENAPSKYENILTDSEYEINYLETKDEDDIKEEIKNKETDLYISFTKDFDDKINDNLMPTVSIYYNSSSPESTEIYNYVYSKLMVDSTNITFNFLVNMEEDKNYDLATDEDISAMIITMMLPFLLLIFLFTGCVSISTESIAGEKERGTIATLLVTPTKRSAIALGKIIALSLTSLVSASASFIGLIASLPKLMGGAGENITISIYGIKEYAGIFGVIIVTILFFTTILSILSTFAKNIKEASQWSSFIMVIVMMMGVSSMMGMGNTPTNSLVYLIPVYNSVQCMSSIFALSFNGFNFIITILSNVLYIGLGVYVLTKMFNSEKIMSAN